MTLIHFVAQIEVKIFFITNIMQLDFRPRIDNLFSPL